MAVVNIMENIVRDRLNALLKNVDCCKCDACLADMEAYALNIIEPKYVNSHTGELYGRIESTKLQNSVDIDIAVAKAINTVSSSPRHKK